METEIWRVFLAALITALATGLGALPFLLVRSVSPYAISLADALAAGMMLAASFALIFEGLRLSPPSLVAGLVLGLAAILAGKRYVSATQDMHIANLSGLGARKAALLIGVMTAHSFAEGVSVGVSFAADDGLSTYITSAIAVHNIPEGLAISVVLVPLGTPVFKAALWSIFSSLPQPLAAVPAFVLVEAFEPFLPIGLGFAAGAMVWMIFSELIPDANRNAPAATVGIVVTLALAAMIAFQSLILQS